MFLARAQINVFRQCYKFKFNSYGHCTLFNDVILPDKLEKQHPIFAENNTIMQARVFSTLSIVIQVALDG